MNIIQCQYPAKGRLAGLWLALVLLAGNGWAADPTFDLIQTKTGVYSNVTVTTKSKDYIVIQHASGLTSLKATELPLEVQQKLGYAKAESKLSSLGSRTITAKARTLVEAIPATKLEEAWNQYAATQGLPKLELNSTIISVALGVLAVSYLFFCLCGSLICQKAGHRAGILMWLPVLQLIPLFRAAKMSPLWLLAMPIPLLNIWAHIRWCFRISRARGKGFWTALFLVLPTYPLAFIYLAFASGSAAPEEVATPQSFKSTDLVLDQG